MEQEKNISTVQAIVLSALRVVIGWHLFYEGVVKFIDPNWSAGAFLAESRWFLSGFFHWVAGNPPALGVIDFLNIWGLLLIGFCLFFGLFTRIASAAGIALLLLYYIANPPLIGMGNEMWAEGNYLLVDKNLVELLSLTVLIFFPPANMWGMDRLIAAYKSLQPIPLKASSAPEKEAHEAAPPVSLPRRILLKHLATIPAFGGFIYYFLRKQGWESYEEKHLMAAAGENVDAVTTATIKTFQFSGIKDLKGQVPHSKIGNLELSRMILGGNLIGGWAHARDLIYASKLVKAYHTDQKVFDTFRIAEQCGINTFLTNPVLARVINKYWRTLGGKIQFISDSAYKGNVMEGIKVSIDGGAHACYVQGGIADKMVEEGRTEEIAKALDFIRQNGVPAGIGAHALETVKACVNMGMKPDFWVKTLHHTNYWSANKENQMDNIWCLDPEGTVEYMKNLEEPWIAFKTLAAGAIEPEVGFQYAFKGGADFICVGMYDFQVVDDVNIVLDVLNNANLLAERERPWRA